MELLIVPFVLAIAVAFQNARRDRVDREIRADQERDDILRAYLNAMTNLIPAHKALWQKPNLDTRVQGLARAWTLVALQSMDRAKDRKRKALLLQFMSDTRLLEGGAISFEGSEIDLSYVGVNFANLRGAALRGINLRGAALWSANLENAKLVGADLYWVFLYQGFLHETDLYSANLESANLQCADLSAAQLQRANLQGANLEEASLEKANLAYAKFSDSTVLPDGSKWTPDTDLERFTDPDRPDFWRSSNFFSPMYEIPSDDIRCEETHEYKGVPVRCILKKDHPINHLHKEENRAIWW
jgi:hypothetical protein